jgi:hypothetical protein
MRIFQKVCGGVDMIRLPINLERRRCRISLYRNGWSDEERSAVYVCAVPFEADAVGKRISLVDVLGFYSDAARPPEAPTLLEAKSR